MGSKRNAPSALPPRDLRRVRSVLHLPQESDPLQGAREALSEGRYADALQELWARAPYPDGHPAWAELGFLFQHFGRVHKAVGSFEHAVRGGGTPEVFLALGRLQRQLRRPGEALRAFEAGLRLAPGSELQHLAGLTCLDLGLHQAASEHFEAAQAQGELATQQNGKGLLQEIYLRREGPRGALLAAEARIPAAWRSYLDPRSAFPPGRDPEKRLRVGFLSDCYRDHPVAQWLFGWLGAFDANPIERIGLNLWAVPDGVTAACQGLFHDWHDLGALGLQERLCAVRALELDLVVDLCEHTRLDSLELVAQRLAPIQVASTIAFAGTRAIPNLDVRFTDAISDPPGEADRWSTERLYRLEGPRRSFVIREDVPFRAEPPHLQKGFFTFGCLVTPCKLTPPCIETFARLLREEPDARLVLLWYDAADAAGMQFRIEQFTRLGVRLEQLDIRPRAPRSQYLAHYDDIDVVLDPFPIFGGTTVLEALWMGVPVIHLDHPQAPRHGGRSILHELDLEGWVVASEEAYVALARQVKADPEHLASLRPSLRSRLESSTLMDHQIVASTFERAFRKLWREWCKDRFPAREAWSPMG